LAGTSRLTQTLNGYTYVSDSPVNQIDPTGFCQEEDDRSTVYKIVSGYYSGGVVAEIIADWCAKQSLDSNNPFYWVAGCVADLFVPENRWRVVAVVVSVGSTELGEIAIHGGVEIVGLVLDWANEAVPASTME
jgi:hypothetical protein